MSWLCFALLMAFSNAQQENSKKLKLTPDYKNDGSAVRPIAIDSGLVCQVGAKRYRVGPGESDKCDARGGQIVPGDAAKLSPIGTAPVDPNFNSPFMNRRLEGPKVPGEPGYDPSRQ
jgi:hypothetical protein